MALQSMYSATKAALLALTSSLRYEFWDEDIRPSTVIPGTVATPIWEHMGGGAPPPFAISPQECARAVLKGLAANERIVVVTDPDREGAKNFSRAIIDPEFCKKSDEWFANNARERKSGKVAV